MNAYQLVPDIYGVRKGDSSSTKFRWEFLLPKYPRSWISIKGFRKRMFQIELIDLFHNDSYISDSQIKYWTFHVYKSTNHLSNWFTILPGWVKSINFPFDKGSYKCEAKRALFIVVSNIRTQHWSGNWRSSSLRAWPRCIVITSSRSLLCPGNVVICQIPSRVCSSGVGRVGGS